MHLSSSKIQCVIPSSVYILVMFMHVTDTSKQREGAQSVREKAEGNFICPPSRVMLFFPAASLGYEY